MKRIALRRKLASFRIAGPEAEKALQRAYAEDSCDDRVSEDIFDVEDEYAEVAIIVQNLKRELH